MSSAGGRGGVSWVGAAGLLVLLTACGNSSAPAAEQPYDGKLYETRDQATYPRAGAAGDVVQCRHFGSGGFEDVAVYGEGATADSPDKALETGRGEGAFDGAQDGFAVAARTQDRVLFVVEADGVPKQAVIVHDGPATDGAGGPGWYVESWARCDWSELPTSAVPDWMLLWTDRHGGPVDTRDVVGNAGTRDQPSVTSLQLGHDIYLRDPKPEFRAYLDHPYAAHVVLPDDAVDTGWSRDEKHLWLAADHRTAYVGSGPADVEAWPAESRRLACG